MWDVASGSIVATIPHAGGDQASEVLAPSGRTVLVGSQTGAVVAFDLSGARRLGRVFQWAPPAQSCVGEPCFVVNRQSDLMATDQGDGSVALVDLHTLKPVGVLPARDGSIATAIALFPDGRTLLTGGSAGRLTLWNVATRRAVGTIDIGAPVSGGAVSPDGKLIAVQTQRQGSSGSVVEVRPAAGGRPLWTHSLPDGTGSVYFSPDGREVAALGCRSTLSTVASWDTRTGPNPIHAATNEPRHRDRESPDSRVLGVGTENGQVVLWNAVRGMQEQPPLSEVATAAIAQLSFSPDGGQAGGVIE